MSDTGRDPGSGILIRGWFAVVYWGFVAVGVVAVVLAFTIGGSEQRIVTGAIVMTGLIVLLIARGLIVRYRRRQADLE